MRLIALIATLFVLGSTQAQTEDFPKRPIRLIVPYGAGGTDLQYRKLADLAGKILGQQVLVENRPGGGGTAAIVQMAQTSPPDGYVIGASTGPLLRQPHMQKVNYDPLKDFTWIAGLGGFTFVVTVKDDSPFKTLAQMIDWAKSNPGKLTYGSPGFASSQYLAFAELSRVAGMETTHVAFKGGNEISTAVIGGHVMVGVNTMAGVAMSPQIRALASFDTARSPKVPDLPTARELGYDVVQSAPYGIVGPAGMPAAVVRKLNDAFRKAVEDPENQALLAQIHQFAWFQTPENYASWARTSYVQERALVERTGLLAK